MVFLSIDFAIELNLLLELHVQYSDDSACVKFPNYIDDSINELLSKKKKCSCFAASW